MRVLVCSAVMIGTQIQADSLRWWWSPSITAALALTPEQAAAIQQVYAEDLPSQQRASKEVIGLTEDIEKRIRDERYDDELLHITGQLVAIRLEQCQLRRRTFELAIQILTPHQQDQLMRLAAEKRLAE
jgi:hypothetical protein